MKVWGIPLAARPCFKIGLGFVLIMSGKYTGLEMIAMKREGFVLMEP